MENGNAVKRKKSFLESPLMSTKVKSANVKIFPEGGLGYFIGPTLALIANALLNVNLNNYMTDVLRIGDFAQQFLNWLPVVSVIFVVLGNVVVGRLMDKNRTRAGKARPLLLLSLPLSILALAVLFLVVPLPGIDKTKQVIALVFLAIGYNLWYAVAYPFYYTSHAAMVSLSTRNTKGRSLLGTISNATSLASVGLCSMILPFFNGLLFNKDTTKAHTTWIVIAFILMGITALGVILEYYFTRERITEESFEKKEGEDEAKAKKAVPLGKQIKACLKDKYWWLIIGLFFFYQLGGMMKNVSQLYYCKVMFSDGGVFSPDIGGKYQGLISMIGAIPTAIGMVIAWPLSNKIGKGKAILFGAILSVIGGAIGFIAPTNFYVVTASFVVKALGSTPAMYLSISLLADMLDHQEAVNKFRTDGFTMTVYGAIMAGMTGIATGILNIVNGATGYNEWSAPEVWSAPSATLQNGMKWLFIGGETICYAAIAILMIFMGVEKFSKLDHKAISKDQKALALAEGREYIPQSVRLKLQEQEADAQAEEARKEELRKHCEAKGLNFEEEEAKYQQAQAEKQAIAEKKKAEAQAKKEAQAKAKQAAFDAQPEQKKAAAEAAKKAKAEKQAKRDAAILEEFNKIRQKNGKEILVDEDLADEPVAVAATAAEEEPKADEPQSEVTPETAAEENASVSDENGAE